MWNLASSNKICNDKLIALVSHFHHKLIAFQQHQKHLNNLANIKPSIDNSCPEIPSFLRSRAKQEKMKESIVSLSIPLFCSEISHHSI